jgi:hypothetical protein
MDFKTRSKRRSTVIPSLAVGITGSSLVESIDSELGVGSDIIAPPVVHRGQPGGYVVRPFRLGHAEPALLLVLACVTLGVGATLSGAVQDRPLSLPVEQSVTRALDEDAMRTPGRLIGAKTTGWGDVTVEFVVTDEGSVQASRAAAMNDALAIVRAIYKAPDLRPFNVTVLGVALQTSAKNDYAPVLYAALPADRVVGRDWTGVAQEDLAVLGAVRWFPAGMCQAWRHCEPVAPDAFEPVR